MFQYSLLFIQDTEYAGYGKANDIILSLLLTYSS